MSVEQRILDVVNANVSAWRDSRELRAIALEVRKREDRIKQLEDRIKRLEEALECIREYWNRDNNNRAMIDACWYAIDKSSEALEAKEAKP